MATHPVVDQEFDQEFGEHAASTPNDSYESLLDDVMHELQGGLSTLSSTDRTTALAEIHAIAETVQKRQERSAGR